MAPAPIQRSRRDRRIDIAFVVVSLLGGVLLEATSWQQFDALPDWLKVVDVALGVASCCALWLRRRWPVGVALALAAPGLLSTFGGIAFGASLFTVAIHRRARITWIVAAVQSAAGIVWEAAIATGSPESWWFAFIYVPAINVGVVAWGMYVRARRELVRSLTDRAERAETERELMAERARTAERSRIAREMHDVLGHRIALIALHAGGLSLREHDDPEVQRSSELIRATARQALEDLRGVVGVLGEGGDGEHGPRAPQPTIADLPRLVEDSRRAGGHVELRMQVDGAGAPPATARDAYRIVQEALTNVHKHARGAQTSVLVRGGPGDGLAVEVRNRLPERVGVEPPLPGSGSGLAGLAERVALSGGTIEHGPSASGEFVVHAELVWAA